MVEHQRPARGARHPPLARALGAGEGAGAVAEELALEERAGEGAGVDLDERPAGARAGGVEAEVRFLQQAAIDIVYSHHERWDGAGYPRGLAGSAIPLAARIFAVVDTYDAITSDRPYRRARGHAAAVAELQRVAGTQLDPEIVEVFARLPEVELRRLRERYRHVHPGLSLPAELFDSLLESGVRKPIAREESFGRQVYESPRRFSRSPGEGPPKTTSPPAAMLLFAAATARVPWAMAPSPSRWAHDACGPAASSNLAISSAKLGLATRSSSTWSSRAP